MRWTRSYLIDFIIRLLIYELQVLFRMGLEDEVVTIADLVQLQRHPSLSQIESASLNRYPYFQALE